LLLRWFRFRLWRKITAKDRIGTVISVSSMSTITSYGVLGIGFMGRMPGSLAGGGS
jgi:hypothetical protein